jgi:NAD-dependent deacetylase
MQSPIMLHHTQAVTPYEQFLADNAIITRLYYCHEIPSTWFNTLEKVGISSKGSTSSIIWACLNSMQYGASKLSLSVLDKLISQFEKFSNSDCIVSDLNSGLNFCIFVLQIFKLQCLKSNIIKCSNIINKRNNSKKNSEDYSTYIHSELFGSLNGSITQVLIRIIPTVSNNSTSNNSKSDDSWTVAAFRELNSNKFYVTGGEKSMNTVPQEISNCYHISRNLDQFDVEIYPLQFTEQNFQLNTSQLMNPVILSGLQIKGVRAINNSLSLEKQIAVLYNLLHDSKSTVVLSGAGLSTDAGIRCLHGTLDYDPHFKEKYYSNMDPKIDILELNSSSIKSTFTHGVLHKWLENGFISGHITQNIDALHFLNKNWRAKEKIAELHGNIYKGYCPKCDEMHYYDKDIRLNKSYSRETAANNSTNQKCSKCDGPIVDTIIRMDSAMHLIELNKAKKLIEKVDLLLVLGTSLIIQQVIDLVKQAPRVIIINYCKTMLDEDPNVRLVLRENIDSVFEKLQKYENQLKNPTINSNPISEKLDCDNNSFDEVYFKTEILDKFYETQIDGTNQDVTHQVIFSKQGLTKEKLTTLFTKERMIKTIHKFSLKEFIDKITASPNTPLKFSKDSDVPITITDLFNAAVTNPTFKSIQNYHSNFDKEKQIYEQVIPNIKIHGYKNHFELMNIIDHNDLELALQLQKLQGTFSNVFIGSKGTMVGFHVDGQGAFAKLINVDGLKLFMYLPQPEVFKYGLQNIFDSVNYEPGFFKEVYPILIDSILNTNLKNHFTWGILRHDEWIYWNVLSYHAVYNIQSSILVSIPFFAVNDKNIVEELKWLLNGKHVLRKDADLELFKKIIRSRLNEPIGQSHIRLETKQQLLTLLTPARSQ